MATSCKNCAFFLSLGVDVEAISTEKSVGLCRRGAPACGRADVFDVATVDNMKQPTGEVFQVPAATPVWPIMTDSDACGEFRRRVA